MAPGKVPALSPLIVFCDFMALGIVVIVSVDTVENGGPQGVAVGINPGPGVGNGVVLTVTGAAEFPVEVHLVTGTPEVRISQFHDTDSTIGIGVAGTDSDDTGFLFNHIDFNDYVMLIFLARQELHIDVFEVAGIVEPFHTAAGKEFIKGLTLLQFHFPKDDLILCLIIADDGEIFHYPFGNIHMENTVRRNLNVRNRNEHVSLLEVHILDFLQLLVHQDEIQHAVLGNIHDGLQVITGKNRISRKCHIMDYGVRSQLVRNAHAFRYFRKGRGNLGEYARGSQGSHIVTDSLFCELGTGFTLDQGRKFRLHRFRDTREINGGNSFSYLCFYGIIIGLGEVQGRIAYSHGLLGLLYRHRRSFCCFRSFIGNGSASYGLSILHADHGTLGHTVRPARQGWRIRKNGNSRK